MPSQAYSKASQASTQASTEIASAEDLRSTQGSVQGGNCERLSTPQRHIHQGAVATLGMASRTVSPVDHEEQVLVDHEAQYIVFTRR